jgi:hypothetical protein
MLISIFKRLICLYVPRNLGYLHDNISVRIVVTSMDNLDQINKPLSPN